MSFLFDKLDDGLPTLEELGLEFPIPALTISQPFATLIATDQKIIENRGWQTDYRGPLMIHAGKGTHYMTKREATAKGYPWGAIVAVANLIDCIPLAYLQKKKFDELIGSYTVQFLLSHPHAEGPDCWILDSVRACRPYECKGARQLWQFNPFPRLATV